MNASRITFKRVVTVAYLLAVHALAIAFVFNQFILPRISFSGIMSNSVNDPTERSPVPTPIEIPDELYNPPVESASNLATPAGPMFDGLKLIIPVVGIKSSQLQDTYTQSRSEGRVHEAIDIMAPGGAPVIAAADGTIVKFHDSERGGITIYQLSTDGRYVYYYAHLQRRAEGLNEGDVVKQGATLGTVGDTGNAGPGNYHLHFSVLAVTDPKRYWNGVNINPFPLLQDTRP